MNHYTNKRILVTGGTGFIGSRLAERFALEEKANVNVLVHLWSKATWVSRSNANLIPGNILNIDEVEKAVSGNEIVFHCVGVGGSLEQCMNINVEGTKNVLNACKKYGVKRIIYLSSVVVHGSAINDNMNEEASYRITGNAYADSKIEAEKYFLSFIKENNIEGVIIRPTFVWGPVSPYYTIDIINQMKTGSFMLIDEGIGSCNAVHVDNVVDLCIICGYHPNANGEAFLITDVERITWKDFWNYYANMLGMDINQFRSLNSKEDFSRKANLILKKGFVAARDFLTVLISRYQVAAPLLTRITLKAPRKIIKQIIAFIQKHNPEIDKWDIETFSSIGFISNEKSKKLLDYSPKITVSQGMEECKIWLSDQNYI